MRTPSTAALLTRAVPAASAFALLAYAYLTLPDVRPLTTTNPSTTAFMELRDREARANGTHAAPCAALGQLQPDLAESQARGAGRRRRCVLAARRGRLRAAAGIARDRLGARPVLRGGSTITQQLAKNLYLSPSKNPLRKLRELVIARRLEAELKKARILELYLNVIEWGDGIYGAEAAARTYFRQSAAALGPAEAALLAGGDRQPAPAQSCTSDARVCCAVSS